MAQGYRHKPGCRCRFCRMSADERARHLAAARHARKRPAAGRARRAGHRRREA